MQGYNFLLLKFGISSKMRIKCIFKIQGKISDNYVCFLEYELTGFVT